MSLISDLAKTRVLNIAHRGARSLCPENTLSAARKAFELGADMWELDVGATRDGELVVLHDNTLERTTNVRELYPERGPWRLQDFSLSEVRSLDGGSWFYRDDPFGQIHLGKAVLPDRPGRCLETIPTLQEALLFTRERDWLVNVEIKDLRGTPGDGFVVEKAVALIGALGMADRVLLSSFNHSYLLRAKRVDPGITLGALVNRPHPTPLALLQQLGVQAYHPKLTGLRLEEIPGVRDRGFDVFVWVANDEKTMRSLIRSRVSGIFTDFPQTLRSVLDEAMRSG